MPKGEQKKTKNRQIAEQEYERIQSRLDELDSQGKFSVLQVPKMPTTRITQSYINKLKAITDDVIEYSTTEKAKHEYEVHLHRSESARRAYWNKRLQTGEYAIEETGELVKQDDVANINYADSGNSINEDDAVINNLLEAIESGVEEEFVEIFKNAVAEEIADNESKHKLAQRVIENSTVYESLFISLMYYEDVGQAKIACADIVAHKFFSDNAFAIMSECEKSFREQVKRYYASHSSSSKRSRR